jgi:ABC-2 type transport system ATP-binding protein
MKSIIEVKHLNKKFGQFTAVNDVSFDVREGEIFGFLGPNGAGKTTTINILCTLMRPTKGRVMLNGFDVVKKPNDVRKSVGLVFQDPSLDLKLTAMQNLQFHASVYDVPRDVAKRRIKKVLDMVDLWDRRKDTVQTYSGGMRRRLEISRGLLHFPKVLFLDEPTIGLDPQTRSHIWDYILELRKRLNITVFLTTHYMDEATVADRIAIIDHGKIVALDAPDNLKRMVGGEVITIKTESLEASAAEILDKYGIESHQVSGGISFEVQNGEEFIPALVRDFKSGLQGISLHCPTLDDVFLKLTGREIREESGGEAVMMKQFAMRQARGGRGFH